MEIKRFRLDVELVRYLDFFQEIIDKTETQELTNCSTSAVNVEDECLFSCLMKRSQEILGCIHPRLIVLDENIWNEDFCDLSDLLTFPGSNTNSDSFDAGFATVQDIIESFRNDKNQDDRFVKRYFMFFYT